MTISPICRIRPKIEDKPPSPPNMPPPNSMPSRPAPRKPAARPPSMPMPGRLKNPPPAGAPRPGVAGWARVRLNGCAVPGAVEVLGGAENVRAPRDPELKPPAARASADETVNTKGTASDKTTAIAWTMPRARCVKFMFVYLKSPAGGSALKMGRAAQKGSHHREPRLRPSVAGGRSFRGDAAHRTWNVEIPGLVLAHHPGMTVRFRGAPSRRRHGFLHRGHQLAQRERLWEERKLLVLRQALFKRVFRIARHEDDLEVRV